MLHGTRAYILQRSSLSGQQRESTLLSCLASTTASCSLLWLPPAAHSNWIIYREGYGNLDVPNMGCVGIGVLGLGGIHSPALRLELMCTSSWAGDADDLQAVA